MVCRAGGRRHHEPAVLSLPASCERGSFRGNYREATAGVTNGWGRALRFGLARFGRIAHPCTSPGAPGDCPPNNGAHSAATPIRDGGRRVPQADRPAPPSSRTAMVERRGKSRVRWQEPPENGVLQKAGRSARAVPRIGRRSRRQESPRRSVGGHCDDQRGNETG